MISLQKLCGLNSLDPLYNSLWFVDEFTKRYNWNEIEITVDEFRESLLVKTSQKIGKSTWLKLMRRRNNQTILFGRQPTRMPEHPNKYHTFKETPEIIEILREKQEFFLANLIQYLFSNLPYLEFRIVVMYIAANLEYFKVKDLDSYKRTLNSKWDY